MPRCGPSSGYREISQTLVQKNSLLTARGMRQVVGAVQRGRAAETAEGDKGSMPKRATRALRTPQLSRGRKRHFVRHSVFVYYRLTK